jgi:hypothetical protein
MTRPSLTAAIIRSKADWYTYLALTIEAEERGESTDDIPCGYDPTKDVLASWDRPAETLNEALEALKLAIDDYHVGDTPRIPAMMEAALGWMKVATKQSQSEPHDASSTCPEQEDTIDDIQTATGCLHALLVSVYEISTEIQFRLPDGRRDNSAERLSALIILARDEAHRIDQRVETYINEMMGAVR